VKLLATKMIIISDITVYKDYIVYLKSIDKRLWFNLEYWDGSISDEWIVYVAHERVLRQFIREGSVKVII
jgi:hypothetical protein